MATQFSMDADLNQVVLEAKAPLLKITLNRAQLMNSLTHEMIFQMKKALQDYEHDPQIKLVIVKGKGKAFCAGGDVIRVVQLAIAGDWTFAMKFYLNQLELDFLVATYTKPIIFFIDGAVMGGGAGLSLNGRFRIVCEKTVFAMPEVLIGHFPDVGVSYFLSRLPGHFGEYLGLTGRRIDGAEMLACGLATHFLLSKDIESLEEELGKMMKFDALAILDIIEKFSSPPNSKKDSPYRRLDVIDKCFSNETVEEILSSLEIEAKNNTDEWIRNAVRSMKLASPTSLKLGLKTIRDARDKTIKQCLSRDLLISGHVLRRTVNADFYEGARATFFDKDKKPKWDPPKLEQVKDEMIGQYFVEIKHEDFDVLRSRDPFPSMRLKTSKL